MPGASRPTPPPPAGVFDDAAVTDDRRVARALRWIRLVTAAMLLVLAVTSWRDAWPMPGVDTAAAVTAIAAWLLATNVWSRRHDHRGHEDDGVWVEVGSDFVLALLITVLGGTLVADTLPLLGVLVVIEAAVRWPRREAALATAVYVTVSVVAILARWPSWAGWSPDRLPADLLPALVALPIALLLVTGLAYERAQTRSVAIGQARRLALVADQLRDANTRLAGSNAELTAFAARIAHDLRSPLSTVVTSLETLERRELELPDDTRERLLAQARHAARRSIDTVDALLDHASSEGRAVQVVPVDVGELATDVIATLPERLLAGIEVELPPGPAPAQADPRLLRLVLQNLVTNAVAHGGSALARVAVRVVPGEDTATVTVADDGVGIPSDQRDEVFAPGVVGGETRGLGLGLATCRSIVARHGGEIWAADSDLGGAAIHFTLPWRSVPDPDAQDTRPTSNSSGSSSRTSSAS